VRVPPIPSSRPEGPALLAELHAALCRYVVLPSAEAADAVTLWIAASHAQPAWEHAPRLAVVSPLKRCGKSRLLDVVAETCHAPLITINATIAAVVRSIGADPPTLLVDEPTPSGAPANKPTPTKTCAACSTPATSATGPCCAGT